MPAAQSAPASSARDDIVVQQEVTPAAQTAHVPQPASATPREIDQSELNSVVGSVAHLAYHVGAIRQIDLSARGPSAND